MLQEAVRISNKKTHLASQLAQSKRFSRRLICETLNVSRSNLTNRLQEENAMANGSKLSQVNAEETAILAEIKAVLAIKSTYGYRRVPAYMNAERYKLFKPTINHKRVYRIMKKHYLLLSKHASKPVRIHNGKVMTLQSNLRWCSDGFCITCDNGDKVNVAFSLDTCDREAISFVATTGGITGEMIRDLMGQTMLRRFGKVNYLPHKIQWLSDNGSCYTARDTVKFDRSIGLEICSTKPYSPESNGMAEAFVKTFKRDYVYLADLSSAYRVMEQLQGWFDDYNENAPHKGLKVLSPRQYIRRLPEAA